RDEHAQHEHRHRDRRERGEARGCAAAHRAQGLAQEEAEPHAQTPAGRSDGARSRLAKSRVVSSRAYRPVASSRTIRPRESSSTRRRTLSTIAWSWVATSTVVPVRL